MMLFCAVFPGSWLNPCVCHHRRPQQPLLCAATVLHVLRIIQFWWCFCALLTSLAPLAGGTVKSCCNTCLFTQKGTSSIFFCPNSIRVRGVLVINLLPCQHHLCWLLHSCFHLWHAATGCAGRSCPTHAPTNPPSMLGASASSWGRRKHPEFGTVLEALCCWICVRVVVLLLRGVCWAEGRMRLPLLVDTTIRSSADLGVPAVVPGPWWITSQPEKSGSATLAVAG